MHARMNGWATGSAGHNSSTVLLAAIPAAVGLVWLQDYASAPAVDYIPSVALLLLVCALGSWLVMMRHDRALCERCVHAMPLSPEERAVRMRRRLWAAHFGARPTVVVPYLIVLIGSDFFTATVTGKIVWSVAQASLVYLVLSHVTHRKLQPWCPECREGGTPLRSTAPSTPTPAGSPA